MAVEHELYTDNAKVYARFADRSAVNSLYDRPAILRLAGDVAGKRVLELGCAGGGLTTQLAERGADVLALDREPRLVALARQRLGQQARIEEADLERPLTVVPSESMDLVVASLVLHYVEHWQPLLAELRRCLKPGGALVFSIHHPFTGWFLSDGTDYHRTELVSEQWDWDGHQVTAQMFRRPLSSIFGLLRDAHFAIDVVDEPRPESDPDVDPKTFEMLKTKPVFLFVRALKS